MQQARLDHGENAFESPFGILFGYKIVRLFSRLRRSPPSKNVRLAAPEN